MLLERADKTLHLPLNATVRRARHEMEYFQTDTLALPQLRFRIAMGPKPRIHFESPP